MPFLKLETNIKIEKKENLLKKLSQLMATLTGKPENWVMISIVYNPDMMFSKKTDPLVYCELKSIGLPEQKTGDFSFRLMDFLQNELAVTPERIYVEFSNARGDMWGWNRDTF